MIVIRTELKLPRSMQRIDKAPVEATQSAMATARDFLREEARRNISKGGQRGLNIRTGNLYRSIRVYTSATPQGSRLSLGSLFYGKVNNDGMTIHAKNVDKLRFYIPGVGWRQAKSVTIPARPWADDAVTALQERFPQMLGQAMRRRLT